jgi:hypothetical protein
MFAARVFLLAAVFSARTSAAVQPRRLDFFGIQ